MSSEDDAIAQEIALSLCCQGTEPGDCLRLCVCGHTSDDHDHRRPGACLEDGCDCWTWRDA
jgi:hypothetical protein